MNTKHQPATQGRVPETLTDSEIERRKAQLTGNFYKLTPEAAEIAAQWWTGPLVADEIVAPYGMTAIEILTRLEGNGYPAALFRIKAPFINGWNKRAIYGAHDEGEALLAGPAEDQSDSHRDWPAMRAGLGHRQ